MKGQVTIFIILGFMILFVFGFLLFIVSKSDSSVSYSQIDTSQLTPYLQSCLDYSLVDSLKLLGEGGGFFIKGASGNPIKNSNPSLGYDNSEIVKYENMLIPIYFEKSDIYNTEFARICKNDQPSGCSVVASSESDIPCECTCNPLINDCDNSVQNYLELSVKSNFKSCYLNLPEFFPGVKTNLIIQNITSVLSAFSIDVSVYSDLVVGVDESSISLPPIYSTPVKLSLVSARRLLFKYFQKDLYDENFNFLSAVNSSVNGVKALRVPFNYNGRNFWITELVFSDEAGSLAGKPYSWFFATEKRDLIVDIGSCYDLDDMGGCV